MPTAPLIVALYGPTSSGKTRLSVELALRLRDRLDADTVIISADSRQVYRHMDIGTSKTTAEEMHGIRHEMIDVADPVKKYELEAYVSEARRHITESLAAGSIPFVVGGTGTYVKSLLEGWSVDRFGEVRDSLRRDFPRAHSSDAYSLLQHLDRRAAGKVHPNNYHAIINALGTVMAGGKQNPTPNPYRHLVLVLDTPQRSLDGRVARAYDDQVRRGLFDEVVRLAERYDLDREVRQRYESENQVLHTHGYREYFEVAHGHRKKVAGLTEPELGEVRSQVIEHIRSYTRRQRSWVGKLPSPRTISSVDQAFALLSEARRDQ